MPLEYLYWNGLYSTDPDERDFVERRVLDHYWRFTSLADRGVTIADIRYVSS